MPRDVEILQRICVVGEGLLGTTRIRLKVLQPRMMWCDFVD
jgi:hypothetical protein